MSLLTNDFSAEYVAMATHPAWDKHEPIPCRDDIRYQDTTQLPHRKSPDRDKLAYDCQVCPLFRECKAYHDAMHRAGVDLRGVIIAGMIY